MRVKSSVCLYSEYKKHVEFTIYCFIYFTLLEDILKCSVSRNHCLCIVERVRVTPRVFLGRIRPIKHIYNVVGSSAVHTAMRVPCKQTREAIHIHGYRSMTVAIKLL